jgi:hypothetical protein
VILNATFDRDGQWLALGLVHSARDGHSTVILDVLNGKRIEGFDFPGVHRKSECVAAFSADGRLLAGIDFGAARLWLLQVQGRTFVTNHCWETGIEWAFNQALVFHPTEPLLAAAGEPFVIDVWDTTTKALLRRMRGHQGYISSLAFSPDGKRLISGSMDHTVRVWDWRLGEELLLLRNKNYAALCARFSPDGLLLATTDSAPPAWLRTAVPWAHTTNGANAAGTDDTDRAAFELAKRLNPTPARLQAAEAQLEAGNIDIAIRELEVVVALRREALGPDHQATVAAQRMLIEAQEKSYGRDTNRAIVGDAGPNGSAATDRDNQR